MPVWPLAHVSENVTWPGVREFRPVGIELVTVCPPLIVPMSIDFPVCLSVAITCISVEAPGASALVNVTAIFAAFPLVTALLAD